MSRTAASEIPSAGPAAAPAALDRPLTPASIVLLVLLTACWGGNAPALRYSLAYLPPFGSAGLRFLIGMVVIYVIARVERVSLRAPREQWAPLGWMALLFLVQIALLNHGAAFTAANCQALLINSYPLFVPLLAHFYLQDDRVTWNKAAGTLLAFGGVLLIFGEKLGKGGGGLYGDLLVTASAALLAAKAVYTSALVRDSHPYQVLFWQMVPAVPAFFLLSLAAEPQVYHWSRLVILSILYQGIVVAGLCFVVWTAMLRQYAPTRLSVGFFLTPVFGALSSYLLLGEPVTGGLLAGGAAILLGLLVANRGATRNA